MRDQSSRPVDWVEGTILRHKDKVFRTALAIMGSMADAEDVSQDAFLKLLEKQPDFESEEHEAAWLIRVTVNLCKNLLRSFWRKNTSPLLETHPAKNEEQHGLTEIVYSLPPKFRTAIHLFYYEGYSTKEISKITGQKESTVRSHLSRARQALKKYLEGADDE